MEERFDELVGDTSLAPAEGASVWDMYSDLGLALPDEMMGLAGLGVCRPEMRMGNPAGKSGNPEIKKTRNPIAT